MRNAGWHRESALRDYLFEHPQVLFDEPVDRKHRELCVEGKFIDLMFEVGAVHYIIELKRDQVTREAVGQVLEYYSRLRKLNPKQSYKVMLVAPKIPDYRRLALEEYGIRCVEVASPKGESLATALSDCAEIRSAVAQTPIFAVDSFAVDRLSFDSFLPPCTQDGLHLSHKLLLDSLPSVQRDFSRFEVKPVRMMHSRPADILCLRTKDGNDYYERPGPWWAYAFGESEHMPKNDKPNISVNGYPWALDFAINAELRTSQRVILEHVHGDRSRFDRLVSEHGGLELQLWMKIEHQPRIYHWVPLERLPVGKWDGTTLIEHDAAVRSEYPALRKYWLAKIFENQKTLSEGQRTHMEGRNRELNLAIRLVRSFSSEDAIWKCRYEEQLEGFDACYRSLRPLVEFFH